MIAKAMRGQEIGQAMVAQLLEAMARKGFLAAYFNPCSEANSHFYAINGFKIFSAESGLQKEP